MKSSSVYLLYMMINYYKNKSDEIFTRKMRMRLESRKLKTKVVKQKATLLKITKFNFFLIDKKKTDKYETKPQPPNERKTKTNAYDYEVRK